MYRSTPHSVTLKSPAELMFNRNIRDKLPVFQQAIEIDSELADRDFVSKDKGKESVDGKRKERINEIKQGDEVVLKRQVPANKLSSTFEPTIFKVVQKKGSEVIVENPAMGVSYRRNVAHCKKITNT